MKERETIFDHAGRVLIIFGVSMLIMILFCRIFGEEAREFSSMFRLGSEGLAIETMLQFFLAAILIEGARMVFFSDLLIKKMSLVMRCGGMLIMIIILISCVIVAYDWFPVNMWKPWIMFFLCFGISFALSLGVMWMKERLENRKMNEGLKRIQKELEAAENNKQRGVE